MLIIATFECWLSSNQSREWSWVNVFARKFEFSFQIEIENNLITQINLWKKKLIELNQATDKYFFLFFFQISTLLSQVSAEKQFYSSFSFALYVWIRNEFVTGRLFTVGHLMSYEFNDFHRRTFIQSQYSKTFFFLNTWNVHSFWQFTFRTYRTESVCVLCFLLCADPKIVYYGHVGHMVLKNSTEYMACGRIWSIEHITKVATIVSGRHTISNDKTPIQNSFSCPLSCQLNTFVLSFHVFLL